LVPPIRGARSGAASAENALVHPVELLAFLGGLQKFAFFWWIVILQERLDGLILLIELSKIRDEILDNVHVWKRIDFGVFALGPVDTA